MINKDCINAWLDVAIKDLEASRVLYNNKLYSNSFYHFQQASEKGFKAYAFISEIYKSEKEVYKDGHYTLKTFKDSLIEMQSGLGVLEKIEFNRLIGKNEFESFSKSLNAHDIIPERKDIIEYPTKVLNEFIDLFAELKNFRFEFPDDFICSFDEKMELFFDSIAKINPSEAENSRNDFKRFKENDEDFEEFMINMRCHFVNMMNMFPHAMVILLSNLISHNHNNISRYPEANFSPLKYYSLKKPIVKKLPEFIRYLNFSLKELKKMNNRINA